MSWVDYSFSNTDWNHYLAVKKALSRIPENASITASESLAPHVSNRREIDTFRYTFPETEYFALWRNEANGRM